MLTDGEEARPMDFVERFHRVLDARERGGVGESGIPGEYGRRFDECPGRR